MNEMSHQHPASQPASHKVEQLKSSLKSFITLPARLHLSPFVNPDGFLGIFPAQPLRSEVVLTALADWQWIINYLSQARGKNLALNDMIRPQQLNEMFCVNTFDWAGANS